MFAMEDMGFLGSVFPIGRSIDQGSGGFRILEEGSGSGEQFRDAVKGKGPLKLALETLFPTFDHVQGHHMRPNSPPQGEAMADTEVTMEGGQETDNRWTFMSDQQKGLVNILAEKPVEKKAWKGAAKRRRPEPSSRVQVLTRSVELHRDRFGVISWIALRCPEELHRCSKASGRWVITTTITITITMGNTALMMIHCWPVAAALAS
ncbi:hypothetical protein J5N97_003768 [Dioscorea zingiberensis]|uniref:Uncharacterized protein n=1 Tax=Dioscorea zingiberensis TaxID=325984 RepID=A0A9D5HRI0_9LILI|nr:hypothetical protein J5N97_003768 [Dioscorea zingiberensis]